MTRPAQPQPYPGDVRQARVPQQPAAKGEPAKTARPEQPKPYHGDVLASLGAVTYRREYRDGLGRAMIGDVTFTGRTGAKLDGVTIPPTRVTVPLTKEMGGVLEVTLLPDTYTVVATLRTVDGAGRATDRAEITLP